jgi:hypothetical protein
MEYNTQHNGVQYTTNIINTCTCTTCRRAVIGMISPNPYVFHLLRVYHFLFTPTFFRKAAMVYNKA